LIVDIKGQNGGLVIIFGPGDIDQYINALKEKFESNPLLFKDFPVTFRGSSLKSLAPEELASLQRLCLDYGMTLAIPSSPKSTKVPTVSKNLIVRKTLRSGQKIIHEGSVIIVGDVHESAEVVAEKDVFVLGRLEGTVHAGCMGDLTSIVAAFRLHPRQVRIGDKISRPPSNSLPNDLPEMAYVEDDHICVKELLSPRTGSKRS